ncbi:hypothetical protein CI610_00834 [invertebrate metagenome]|uniref:Cation efflux protein transmembrane domain-containing protein n=1 Tax=invertebrate metagenome TaxID=1711999 RepID=A0A2H9TAC9_9ZZZZ
MFFKKAVTRIAHYAFLIPYHEIILMVSEQKALIVSVFLEMSFGLAGITIAIESHSDVILLDGAYSTVCCFIMMANLKVARIATKHITHNSSFENTTLEPFIITLQALIILTFCALLAISSIWHISNGGYFTSLTGPVIYELFSISVGILATGGFYTLSKATESSLLSIECQEWLFDTLLSLTAMSAFLLGIYLGRTHPWTPFIDPAITLLMVVFIAPYPLRILRTNIQELMLRKIPDTPITREICIAIRKEANQLALPLNRVYPLKTGRWLHIIIEYSPSYCCKKEVILRIDRIAQNTAKLHTLYYRIHHHLVVVSRTKK